MHRDGQLLVCATCACLAKPHETTCPSCGASLRATRDGFTKSTAALVAMGLVVVACGSEVKTTTSTSTTSTVTTTTGSGAGGQGGMMSQTVSTTAAGYTAAVTVGSGGAGAAGGAGGADAGK